ncbi:MAG: hypothetical protein DI598_06860 [Pseudopedobacter saltans]|uniref:Uncharacterized protein n=1 Tax=Pseudopedobacter saltans TaxID=151895 RepID=A0A2W5F3B9_9SPHI|nr:MAG: hypothetical protein DI598_06860 [Pseudopedobacter saltans]
MKKYLFIIVVFCACTISRESSLKKINHLKDRYDIHGDGDLNFSDKKIKKKDFNGLYEKIEYTFATRPDFTVSDLNDGSTKNYFYNKNKIDYLTNNGLIREGMIFLKDSSEIAKFKKVNHLD